MKSNFENVDNVVLEITKKLSEVERFFPREFISMLDFVLRELLNNAVEHGNNMEEDRLVKLSLEITNEELIVDIYDEGKGYNPKKSLEKTENDDNFRVRNRGILSIYGFGFEIDADGGHTRAIYRNV